MLVRVRVDPKQLAEYAASGATRVSKTLHTDAPRQAALDEVARLFELDPELVPLSGSTELTGLSPRGAAVVFATVAVVPGAGGTYLEISLGRAMRTWLAWVVMGIVAPASLFGVLFAGFFLKLSPLVAALGGVAALTVVIVGYRWFAERTGARWAERTQLAIGRIDTALKALPNNPTYRG